MSEMVGNPKDRFSRVAAHLAYAGRTLDSQTKGPGLEPLVLGFVLQEGIIHCIGSNASIPT